MKRDNLLRLDPAPLRDEMIFPREIAGSHKAIIGMTGSGKTGVGKRYIEQLLERPRRVAVIDPTGAWWGMRLMADGVTRSPYNLFIMGGEHGDRPLNPRDGRMLGGIVARSQISVIFDLSLMHEEEQRQFTADFLEAVHEDNRKPLYLVVDEADIFAPQRASAHKGCKEALLRIMQHSRIRKISCTLITQRIAVIDKTALSQAQATIAMQFTSVPDRRVVDQLFSAHRDPDDLLKFKQSLPSLKAGEGWLWCQKLGKLRLRQFPFIETYDCSSSFGFDDDFAEYDQTFTLPALDLAELDTLLSENTLPPAVEVESDEIRLLRESHADLLHENTMLREREEQMVREGLASPDVTIDSADHRDIDKAMLSIVLAYAATGKALSPTELIAAAAVDNRPLAHRSLLRMLTEGSVVIRDNLIWPTTATLRTADRSNEDFARSVDIEMGGIVTSKPLMSKPERKLLDVIAAAAHRLQLHVLPQVGMGSFLDVAEGISPADEARARHAFAGRHVDFVVCDGSAEVKAIIELDDHTHNAVTDAFRDAAAKAAGIPTLRLLNARTPTVAAVERMLRAILSGQQPDVALPSLRRATLPIA